MNVQRMRNKTAAYIRALRSKKGLFTDMPRIELERCKRLMGAQITPRWMDEGITGQFLFRRINNAS